MDRLKKLVSALSPKSKDDFTAETEINVAVREAIAELVHDLWVFDKFLQGWKYGPITDAEKLTHANFVPYDALPESEKQKDRKMVGEALLVLNQLGYAVRRREGATTRTEVIEPLDWQEAVYPKYVLRRAVYTMEALDNFSSKVALKLAQNAYQLWETPLTAAVDDPQELPWVPRGSDEKKSATRAFDALPEQTQHVHWHRAVVFLKMLDALGCTVVKVGVKKGSRRSSSTAGLLEDANENDEEKIEPISAIDS